MKEQIDNLEGPPPILEERAAMARELDRVAPTPADKFGLMLGQRPTPRTDAVRFRVGESDHWAVHEVYAKQLERELAEAREEGEEQARLLGMSGEREAGLLAEIDRLKRELDEVREQVSSRNKRLENIRRERDNSESDRRQAEADAIRALHERNEARGQKWRLAEACRWAQRELGKHTRPSPIDKALAALKGGTSD